MEKKFVIRTYILILLLQLLLSLMVHTQYSILLYNILIDNEGSQRHHSDCKRDSTHMNIIQSERVYRHNKLLILIIYIMICSNYNTTRFEQTFKS